MCASDRPSPSKGFSLVELLVAMVFLSILMAGMFRIFAASLSNSMTANESINIQRAARWGLTLLQDDILQAGYQVPPRLMTIIDTSATAQPPILMQATTYTPPGSTRAVDELQFIMDIPLEVQGTLAADVAVGATTVAVTIPYGASLIQPGDVMFVQDSNWELLKISTASSSAITIDTSAGAVVNALGDDRESLVRTAFGGLHKNKAPFAVLRQEQVVRFTVVPRSLDPGDATATTPCLVRQSRPLSVSPATIWAPTTTAVPAAPATEEILLEGVTDFRVDWSLDGGKTWIRATAGDIWNGIRTAVNTALTGSSSPFVKQAGGLSNPADPFWLNYSPLLIRIDVETRTRIQRSEYDATGTAAAFRTRRETLMLSPRNFALGRP